MKKKYIVASVIIVSCLVALTGLAIGSLLNIISFHGTIGPGASMSRAITLDLGYIAENSTGGSGPSENGTPINGSATLTVPELVNVTLAFANTSSLSPFTAFSCLVQLYQNGSPIYQGSITQSLTSFQILNVAVGTYNIWIGYTYTAGPDAANVNITVNVSVS